MCIRDRTQTSTHSHTHTHTQKHRKKYKKRDWLIAYRHVRLHGFSAIYHRAVGNKCLGRTGLDHLEVVGFAVVGRGSCLVRSGLPTGAVVAVVIVGKRLILTDGTRLARRGAFLRRLVCPREARHCMHRNTMQQPLENLPTCIPAPAGTAF